VVGEAQDPQAPVPGHADVLGHTADRVVGKGRVDVVVLVERWEA
jgi:hypothetical protein